MLFEVHDILLHRLWKMALKARKEVINQMLDGKTLTRAAPLYWTQKRIYFAVLSLERLTRRWYFNHYPKLHFVFP